MTTKKDIFHGNAHSHIYLSKCSPFLNQVGADVAHEAVDRYWSSLSTHHKGRCCLTCLKIEESKLNWLSRSRIGVSSHLTWNLWDGMGLTFNTAATGKCVCYQGQQTVTDKQQVRGTTYRKASKKRTTWNSNKYHGKYGAVCNTQNTDFAYWGSSPATS